MQYTQAGLPRWRGFNLLGMYTTGHEGYFPEEDFQLIAELGFDFVRLPLSYRTWTVDGDLDRIEPVYQVNEKALESIDACVRAGEKYGLHINLNLHRAPGYCINPGEKEPFNLWKDGEAVKAFAWHWELFAKRYRDIPSSRLSFDLVNEPLGLDMITREEHKRAISAAVKAIRAISPNRLVIADGMGGGNIPCPELADLNIAQSCRAYQPMTLTHHKAEWWTPSKNFTETPHWPDMMSENGLWNRQRLIDHYAEWAKMSQELGIGVHCGEGGAYWYTPHDVVVAWMRDVMDVLQGYNIGYALWNFRGQFGILDSGRKDCAYEEWRGHLLDRQLYEILKAH